MLLFNNLNTLNFQYICGRAWMSPGPDCLCIHVFISHILSLVFQTYTISCVCFIVFMSSACVGFPLQSDFVIWVNFRVFTASLCPCISSSGWRPGPWTTRGPASSGSAAKAWNPTSGWRRSCRSDAGRSGPGRPTDWSPWSPVEHRRRGERED